MSINQKCLWQNFFVFFMLIIMSVAVYFLGFPQNKYGVWYLFFSAVAILSYFIFIMLINKSKRSYSSKDVLFRSGWLLIVPIHILVGWVLFMPLYNFLNIMIVLVGSILMITTGVIGGMFSNNNKKTVNVKTYKFLMGLFFVAYVFGKYVLKYMAGLFGFKSVNEVYQWFYLIYGFIFAFFSSWCIVSFVQKAKKK